MTAQTGWREPDFTELMALKRIAAATPEGGINFPDFMMNNMDRWKKFGWIEIVHENGWRFARITEAGRTALAEDGVKQ